MTSADHCPHVLVPEHAKMLRWCDACATAIAGPEPPPRHAIGTIVRLPAGNGSVDSVGIVTDVLVAIHGQQASHPGWRETICARTLPLPSDARAILGTIFPQVREENATLDLQWVGRGDLAEPFTPRTTEEHKLVAALRAFVPSSTPT